MSRETMPAAEAGFALAEALVAAAIIAAALGVTYEAVTTGTHAAAVVQDERQAALLAQSKLADVGATIALTPGTSGGRDGPFSWQVAVSNYGEENARDDAPPLLMVSVTVRHAGESKALLRLQSLRVGA